MVPRDIESDMRAAIAAAVAGRTEYTAAVEGQKLTRVLLETDPELIVRWLQTNAPRFLAQEIRSLNQRNRSIAARRANSRYFAAKAAKDPSLLAEVFAVRYVVDPNNTMLPLSEMTGSDHRFVASRYGTTARKTLMLEAFHRAVADRVGERKTKEVFTEEEYLAMYRSLVHRDTP